MYRAPPLTGGGTGFGLLRKVPCRALNVIGAASGSFGALGEGMKWVLVSLRSNPRVRGWMGLSLAGTGGDKIAWSRVPVVEDDVLAPKGSPDIVFAGLEATDKPGEPCYGAGGYGTWWVTIRNRGTGAGEIRLYVRKATGLVPFKSLHVRRALFPKESVTFIYSNAELVLSGGGANRILDVPPPYPFTCRRAAVH